MKRIKNREGWSALDTVLELNPRPIGSHHQEFEEENSRLEESRQRQIKKNNEKEHGKSSQVNDTIDRY